MVKFSQSLIKIADYTDFWRITRLKIAKLIRKNASGIKSVIKRGGTSGF